MLDNQLLTNHAYKSTLCSVKQSHLLRRLRTGIVRLCTNSRTRVPAPLSKVISALPASAAVCIRRARNAVAKGVAYGVAGAPVNLTAAPVVPAEISRGGDAAWGWSCGLGCCGGYTWLHVVRLVEKFPSIRVGCLSDEDIPLASGCRSRSWRLLVSVGVGTLPMRRLRGRGSI